MKSQKKMLKRFLTLFFGDGFEGAIPIMRIFSPIIYVIGISDCLGMLYYTPVGKRKISSQYIIVGAFTNVCLNILFVPNFKAEGAAVASVLAELVIEFLYIRNSAGYCSFQKLFVSSRKKIVAGLVMATFVYFIGKIQLNIFARVILQIVFGGATYVALLVLLKDDVSKIIIGLIKH